MKNYQQFQFNGQKVLHKGITKNTEDLQILHEAASKPPHRKPFVDSTHNFKVGAMIQFGVPPSYGVIKWIGSLRNYACLMAGVKWYV